MESKENEMLEYKKSLNELKQGVISLASMLNKNAEATLYFGILNNGIVVGEKIDEQTLHNISLEIAKNIHPNILQDVKNITLDGKNIVEVYVRGFDKPYTAYSRYYIRKNDEDVLMTNEELLKIFKSKKPNNYKWEVESSGFGIEEIDENLLIRYCSDAHEAQRISFVYKDAKDALLKLGLLKDDKLNNAGYYLFSKNKMIKLKMIVFNTERHISFSDLRLFEGNIFECIETSIRFILDNIKWIKTADNKTEEPEIPLEAIKEIVVNSFAHMKISESSSNEIYITPSKVKITNSTAMVKNQNPENFALDFKGPVIRYPLIAMTLYKNKMMNLSASGFSTVYNLCVPKGVRCEHSYNKGTFTFIFNRRSYTTKSARENSIHYNELNHRRNAIINMLKKNSETTTSMLSKKLKVSSATIARDLRDLQKIGLLKRDGATKNGHWEVL